MSVRAEELSMPDDDLDARNRKLVRVLLAIVAVLVLGAFMIGVRW
jgi:hypothetical protein